MFADCPKREPVLVFADCPNRPPFTLDDPPKLLVACPPKMLVFGSATSLLFFCSAPPKKVLLSSVAGRRKGLALVVFVVGEKMLFDPVKRVPLFSETNMVPEVGRRSKVLPPGPIAWFGLSKASFLGDYC